MVATSDCGEKGKPGNKVSKPLMEKKRRARINQCLDELKSLLESFYSSSIRKRKLEKADILELTVKHLRNLQKIQSGSLGASEFPDYQLGFRSCLANVNHYLLLADHLNGSERWMLSQLSSKLCPSRRRGESSSTTDSEPGQTAPPEEAQNLRLPRAHGHEEGKPAKSETAKLQAAHTVSSLPSEDVCQLFDSKQIVFVQKVPAGNMEAQMASHKKPECVSPEHEAGNTELSVWRPW
ncbi:hairy-related 3 [Fundulus diaphanus]